MKQKKGKKHATVKDVPQTQEAWKQLVTDLGFYDSKYEQEKYLLKEYNLTEYCLQGLDLLSKIKGTFSPDSYIIALIEMNRQKNKSAEQLKLFLTSFLASFKALQLYSNELSYLTRLVNPEELPKRSSKLFGFYLKVRKYVFTNFVNERDPVVQPMQFEQWVSVVSKFLDNKAIVTIGNQIKERKKEKDKNAVAQAEQNVNFVDPYDLVMLCYEEEEKRYQKKKEQKKQLQEQKQENKKDTNGQEKEKDKQQEKDSQKEKEKQQEKQQQKQQEKEKEKKIQIQQKELEQSQEKEEKKGNQKFLQSDKANQLAYKIAMGPSDNSSMKQSREKSVMKQDSEYSSDPEQSHKMVADINNAKQKVLSDMIKQQQNFKQVLSIHESLAMNYKYVANFTQELQELVSEVIEKILKIKKGQSINEAELRNLEQHSNFSEFLPEDPEITLEQSGIYETLKQ